MTRQRLDFTPALTRPSRTRAKQPATDATAVMMLFYNRELTEEEYDKLVTVLLKYIPLEQHERAATGTEPKKKLLAEMLPFVLLHGRKVPRDSWAEDIGLSWRLWKDRDGTGSNATLRLSGWTEYQFIYDDSLIGMATSRWGVAPKSGDHAIGLGVAPGLGIKSILIPKGMSVSSYVNSLVELTEWEKCRIMELDNDSARMDQCCRLLAMKQAYATAISQPRFECRRIEMDCKLPRFTFDSASTSGWEFRWWVAIRRGTRTERYMCARALFRGGPYTSFVRHRADCLVAFDVDALLRYLPRLEQHI